MLGARIASPSSSRTSKSLLPAQPPPGSASRSRSLMPSRVIGRLGSSDQRTSRNSPRIPGNWTRMCRSCSDEAGSPSATLVRRLGGPAWETAAVAGSAGRGARRRCREGALQQIMPWHSPSAGLPCTATPLCAHWQRYRAAAAVCSLPCCTRAACAGTQTRDSSIEYTRAAPGTVVAPQDGASRAARTQVLYHAARRRRRCAGVRLRHSTRNQHGEHAAWSLVTTDE